MTEHGVAAKPSGVLVVAAHPDDETVGCAGLLGRVSDARIAYLTDGVPSDGSLRPAAFRDDADAYRAARAEEVRRALSILDMDEKRVLRLGAVDQESSYLMLPLVQRLIGVIEEVRPSVVITHPYEGGHPDHDTAAFVVRVACMIYANRRAWRPTLLEMTSYHAREGRLVTGTFLDDDREGGHIFTLALSTEERRKKEIMMSCFETQRSVLASFGVEAERFRRAPAYDFSQPPHRGALYYEQLGWPLTGRRWRELASDAERRLLG